MNRKTWIVAVALALTTVAAPVLGAGVGFHAGMCIDPDDLLLGVHWKSDPVAENILIVPSAELGVGDFTMIAGNLDGHFVIPTDSQYKPYVGAGITINWFDFDGGSDTEFGGSILGGFTFTEQWYFEAKIGLGDVPDAKLYVGYDMP